MTIEEIILNAYDKADRAIGDSDLDDEQPLSLNIRLTLGDIRSLRRWRQLRESIGAEPDDDISDIIENLIETITDLTEALKKLATQ